jgi:transcriptional regulator with XRE-family HTH domain
LLWRTARGLTQVEAARRLGLSQPYLSLIEKGCRPAPRGLAERLQSPETDTASRLREFGWGGAAEVNGGPAELARCGLDPAVTIHDALIEADLDLDTTLGVVWLASRASFTLRWKWLVTQAKLSNTQNRLCYLCEWCSGAGANAARSELSAARLLAESTFCCDSISASEREFLRASRGPRAAYWNIVPQLDVRR